MKILVFIACFFVHSVLAHEVLEKNYEVALAEMLICDQEKARLLSRIVIVLQAERVHEEAPEDEALQEALISAEAAYQSAFQAYKTCMLEHSSPSP